MNSSIRYILAFAAGLGLGALGASYILKNKYKDISNEEIEAIKERYKEKEEALMASNKSISKPDVSEMAKDIKKYEDIIEESGYSKDNKEKKTTDDNILIITEKKYDNEEPEFGKADINFYKGDSVLADIDDTILDAIDYIGQIGLEEVVHTKDDVVYIRNVKDETDYAINIYEDSYTSIVGEYPERDG